jgi:two-component system chemotaxis response regulator CheY
VQTYQTIKPDTVFVDVTRPEKDGLEALNGVCGVDPETKVTKVITLEQIAMTILAVQSGVKDYMISLFNPAQVTTALQKVLG